MNYGMLIDENFNDYKQNTYVSICNYYKNPIMTKTKNVDLYSVYMSEISSGYYTEYKYIIAMVPVDQNNIGTEIDLKFLNWASFQTRLLKKKYKTQTFFYEPDSKYKFNYKLNLMDRKDDSTIYNCENLPIIITLINSDTVYPAKGTLVSALETYNTIINFK